MQYGTFARCPSPPRFLAARKPCLAASIAIGGTVAWFCKAVKGSSTGSPREHHRRCTATSTEEGFQGFPSGHAAVSTAITVVTWPNVSTTWRFRSRHSPGSFRSGGCTSVRTCQLIWSAHRRSAGDGSAINIVRGDGDPLSTQAGHIERRVTSLPRQSYRLSFRPRPRSRDEWQSRGSRGAETPDRRNEPVHRETHHRQVREGSGVGLHGARSKPMLARPR